MYQYAKYLRLIVFLLLLITVNGSAQIPDTLWTKTFGGFEREYGEQVQQTIDGGYIIFGSTFTFGAGMNDIYLVKTDSFGILEWDRSYGTVDAEASRSGQQTADSGYIILANKSDAVLAEDTYLIKIDQYGDTVWSKTYGGTGQDVSNEIQQTTDLGYIFVGFTGSYGPGILYGPNVYLVKTDSLGNILWFQAYGDTTWDMGFSVQQTTDGGYIIVGITDYFHYDTCDVYLIRTNAVGDTVWSRTYGGSGYDFGERVRQTADGGYIIVGETNSFGAGNYDIYAIRTDSIGDTLWTRTYGGPQDDCSMDVQEIAGSGYIIVGCTRSFGNGGNDVYLVRIHPNGDTIWTKTIGGSQQEYGESICITSDTGYIICGETSSYGAGTLDVFLIKIEPDTMGIEVDESRQSHGIIIRTLPNPQRRRIAIQYFLSKRCDVRINIYNALGGRIETIAKKNESPGQHLLTWGGTDTPSGVYFVKFEAGNFSEVQKAVLLK